MNIREDPLRCGASRLLVFHTAGKRFPSPDFPIRERNQQKNWRESWNRVLQALDIKRAHSDPEQSGDAQPCRIRKESQRHGKPGDSFGGKRAPKREVRQ